MNHIYQDIDGWFDFEDFYRQMVAEAPQDRIAHFVEVGCFLGKSLCFLTVEAINSGKRIIIHAVDRWMPYAPDEEHGNADCVPLMADAEAVYQQFMDNIGQVDDGRIRVWRLSSLGVAQAFVINDCDMVFLDANHARDAVAADIAAWLPKVRPGGVLAGHDWPQPSVREAVMAAVIGRDVRTMGSVWYWRKPE